MDDNKVWVWLIEMPASTAFCGDVKSVLQTIRDELDNYTDENAKDGACMRFDVSRIELTEAEFNEVMKDND